MKVAICTPTIKQPFDAYLESLEASVPALDAAEVEHVTVFEVGCPYISGARCTMLGKALVAGADQIIFVDHDLEWEPEALPKLIRAEGDVVCGTYRYKKDEEEYMGVLETDAEGHFPVRADGCIPASRIPGGFLRITREAVGRFLHAYPELRVGGDGNVDLFNHGAMDGIWHGEDYAFSRRWKAIGGDIWIVPDLNLTHHGDKPFPGNFHRFLLRQPGGSEHQHQRESD